MSTSSPEHNYGRPDDFRHRDAAHRHGQGDPRRRLQHLAEGAHLSAYSTTVRATRRRGAPARAGTAGERVGAATASTTPPDRRIPHRRSPLDATAIIDDSTHIVQELTARGARGCRRPVDRRLRQGRAARHWTRPPGQRGGEGSTASGPTIFITRCGCCDERA